MEDLRREYGQADRDGSAAAAFAQLGAEVVLLRRAIEGLTAARDVEVPDYTATLMRTEQLLASLADRIATVMDSPALTMTPDVMTVKIVNAAHSARLDDQRLINEALVALGRATGELTKRLASARARGEQNRRLYGLSGGALVAGALFWAEFAAPVARAMPQAWHWPERMAARTVDKSMWAAGQDLMASANPRAWHAIVSDVAIVRGSRAASEKLRPADANRRGVTPHTGKRVDR